MRIFFVIACLLLAAPASAGTYYGAIAYSLSDGHSGYSWNQNSKPAAEKRALKQCKKQGGKKCKIKVTAHNSCGAFAVSVVAGKTLHGGSSWGYNTAKDAKARALKGCKQHSNGHACKVVAYTCNFGK